MKLSLFFVLTSFVASTFAVTAAQVRADINAIELQITTLDKSISAFQGIPLTGIPIHINTVALISAINKGTDDVIAVTPKPIFKDDAKDILSAAQALSIVMKRTLDDIVAKKSSFLFPAWGFIKNDLSDLSASVNSFQSALILVVPDSLVTTATELKDSTDDTFASAIAAYA